MKKLMVLAAGLLQIPVIKKAKENGFYVIAVDDDSNAPGMAFADKAIVPGGLINEEKMLAIAQEEQIDGVIHPCSEVAMNVMGHINDEMGLHGISKEIAIRATNKHLMREAFERYGAPSPKSRCFNNVEVAWGAFCTDFHDDAILKPSRNSGSRGIAKITNDIKGEEFAKLTGYELNTQLIKRIKDTKPQYNLKKSQRLINLDKAFEVDKTKIIEGKRLLLIDDICTTGSTFEEMIRELNKTGIYDIACFATTTPAY